MRKLLYTFVFTCITVLTYAQNCACCSNYHQQFDFWLGTWTVKDTLGHVVGENTISKIEGNCVIQEKWTGAKGSTGTSLNYFDITDSTWNQVWVDNNGGVLNLKGEYSDGSMILKSARQKGKNGSTYINQISWTLNNDQTVTQLWEVYNTDLKTVQVIFKGIYHPKK